MLLKKEIIKQVKEQYQGLTLKNIELVFDAILKVVKDGLKSGDEVMLKGFGNFKVKTVAEKEAINPKNQEKIIVPEHKVLKFKSSKAFNSELK